MREVTFARHVTQMKLDNMDNWDSFLVIDGCDDNRHGAVGLGKTNIELAYLLYLDPRATIVNNMVVVDDVEQYKRLLYDPSPFVVIALDEAEHFWYKRMSMHGRQIQDMLRYMSNRKERKFHIGALPRIWDVDKSILNQRVQWRLKVEDRGRASLYMRTAPWRWNEKKDEWGLHLGTFVNVDVMPRFIWSEYQYCINTYRPAVVNKSTGQVRTSALRGVEVWDRLKENEQPLSPEGYTSASPS